jgi:hypothetical protein
MIEIVTVVLVLFIVFMLFTVSLFYDSYNNNKLKLT